VSCREGYYLGRDGSCHSIQNTAARKTTASSGSGELISRTYQWNFKGTSYSWKVSIPKSLYDYYRAQPHDRSKLTTYNEYAISAKDKPYLDAMITRLKESGKNKGYTESENIMNVIAFVQGLPYFKDDVSTTYNEYPRYPVETLVDNGGDCEDTAILTAALLREMGYGVVLINPPGHIAVGVKCSSCTGTYYTYNGARYYYLETTGTGFKVGEMPSSYENTKVKIIPLG
jgi:predicted transglutaminase-like cysteine proteinase